MDGGAVSWSSWKQELVTLSTAEAEYIAALTIVSETPLFPFVLLFHTQSDLVYTSVHQL